MWYIIAGIGREKVLESPRNFPSAKLWPPWTCDVQSWQHLLCCRGYRWLDVPLHRHYHGNGRCSCGCCVRDRLSDWDETIRSPRQCWTTPWNSWSVKWTRVQVWLTARCSHELLLHAVLLLSQLLVHIWQNKSPVSSLCLGSNLSVKIAIVCIVSNKLWFWCCWLGGRKGIQPVKTE